MSKPDKPIFNQQGGRGQLYGPTHGATYMGTYQMPDGKMDRRMFNCVANKDAIKVYTDWCESFDKAVAVCDALTLGAKASGFAATYDVVEVKKWTA